MANNNNDDSQRNSSRPEDNPFIAFRRYADSQVSSLLNTVFALPAQIANYNAHNAREQCLFGKADPQKCEELQALDAHTEKLRHESADLYRAGDVQALVKKGEQYTMLERQASELRRAILSDAEGLERGVEQQKQLLEHVGNKKGQQWSDSWDWPAPTRDEEQDDSEFGRWLESRARKAGGEIERMLTRLEEDATRVFGEEVDELRKHWAARNDTSQPRTWSRSWSWQWPPPADAAKRDEARLSENPYSPSALEADEQTRHMGSLWRNAFDDLMRTTQEHPLLSDAQNTHFDQMGLYALHDYQKQQMQLDQQNTKRLLMARHEHPRRQALLDQHSQVASDEPSYEYSHDHEDQHDDPPTPKSHQTEFPQHQTSPTTEQQNTETELDAYERLLNPTSQIPAHSTPDSATKPSILSTLTTTERTTAPDGTITTKVVLKKRFADGSEQSSETIHTQRGQDVFDQVEDPWKMMQNAQAGENGSQKGGKRGGWFWSN
jgi:hypothetical protein